MTLREVEEASDRSVSNAYVSQLETGRVKAPSPGVLRDLAAVYGARMPRNSSLSCSFDRMMELAGHVPLSSKPPSQKRGSRLSQLGGEELTPEEEDELLKYLAFIRMRKGTR